MKIETNEKKKTKMIDMKNGDIWVFYPYSRDNYYLMVDVVKGKYFNLNTNELCSFNVDVDISSGYVVNAKLVIED